MISTFLCWLFDHPWKDTKPAKNSGPGEQQCERCGEYRHHAGKNAYDEVDWQDGPLPG